MAKLKLKAWVPKEWSDQRTVIEWASLMAPRYPALELLHASLNGTYMKSPQQAMTAKLAGMKNGVLDLSLPWPRSCDGASGWIGYHGAYIEVKRKDQITKRNGGLSDDQIWWLNRLSALGYYATVCFGAHDAIVCLSWYVGVK